MASGFSVRAVLMVSSRCVITRRETNTLPSPEVSVLGGPLQFPHTAHVAHRPRLAGGFVATRRIDDGDVSSASASRRTGGVGSTTKPRRLEWPPGLSRFSTLFYVAAIGGKSPRFRLSGPRVSGGHRKRIR